MSLPKISAIIPSFNQACFMEATLQIVIDQNYPNLLVIEYFIYGVNDI